MNKTLLFIALFLGLLPTVNAQNSDVEYKIGVGFNVGGTMPIGLPAEIRGINSYSPTANLSVSGHAMKMFNSRWGAQIGLRIENKGHNAGIDVKNYRMTLNIGEGDDTGVKRGYFTGSIKNKTRFTYLTIPVSAVYRLNDKWDFRIGAYASYALDRSFEGHVVKGHVRETPMTAIIGITKADYDYTDDLRRFDAGIELGTSFKVYRSLAINADLTWGGIKTLSPDTRKIDMDNYNIYLNIGVCYTL